VGELKVPSDILTKMFFEQQNKRCVLFGVMAATSAPNQTTAMGIVGDLKLYDVTIGVLTKCDEVADSGLKKKLVDIVDQSSSAATKLDSGYFATALLSPNEDVWFESKKEVLSPVLQAKRAGVSNLVNSMNDFFLKYIAETWIPNTLKLLKNANEHLEQKMQILGLPKTPTNRDVQDEVQRCVQLAITTSPCFAKFKVELDAAWAKTTTTNSSSLAGNSTKVSLEILQHCATKITVNSAGLASPWSEALDDISNLLTDLQDAMVKQVEVKMTEESALQLKRFPKVIKSTI